MGFSSFTLKVFLFPPKVLVAPDTDYILIVLQRAKKAGAED